MMGQYLQAKRAHPDCIVLFRMGDFYEMFGEDAREGAALLDLVVTSRDREEPKMPMAGVPHHALEQYLGRLLKAGRKVAICEQMEDPSKAKGIVRREVTRVVTPGTVFDPGLLDDRANNFLAAVVRLDGRFAVALADVSTGEFQALEVLGGEAEVALELLRARAAEVIAPAGAPYVELLSRALSAQGGPPVAAWRAEAFHPAVAGELLRQRFALATLEGLGIEEGSAAAAAAGAALAYVEASQMGKPSALRPPRPVSSASFLDMDPVTQRNLELIANLRDGSTKGTLVSLLDRTATPMGGRLLRGWLQRPLLDPAAIGARQGAVAFLFDNAMLRERLRRELAGVRDLERLTSRTSAGYATPRDLTALRASLAAVASVKEALSGGGGAARDRGPLLRELIGRLDDLPPLRTELDRAVVDDPPATATEGGLIRPGYSEELDKIKGDSKGARDWVNGLQARERERTAIKTLKVGYNRVFGYYIEVSRGQAASVPPDYERRQTLANAERYVTPDLKRHEELVLSADEQAGEVEKRLFDGLVARVASAAPAALDTAGAVAGIDTLLSLASAAADRGYVRPTVDVTSSLVIRDGRHPVVEVSRLEGDFVPNDTLLDTEKNQLMVITGPNMAGKSTYMRQVALIAIMAQVGSFVPAQEARVGVVDRILTRVGATDYVTAGQSTFMVEMVETARILNLATARSLVLLDEIGRGTSTFDGLSIAWAVAEWLHDGAGAHPRTLFATHYHQLTDLERDHPRVVNYHLTAREHEGGIVFLRRLMPGSTDKSYGIQVARLAGIPDGVLRRASEVLALMEEQHAVDLAESSAGPRGERSLASADPPSPVRAFTQSLLFSPDRGGQDAARRVMERLKEANPESMTAIEARALLDELRSLATGRPPAGAKPAASARPGAASAPAAKRRRGGGR